MARLILYYAHPAHNHSQANAALWAAAQQVAGITRVDLYAEYPRHDIDVPREQARLVDHDVVLLQFPVFWYSAPALVKDWIDLVFEHGFAYGRGGDALAGLSLMLALTTGGAEEAYTPQGYQYYPLRTFLTPFEQTARLCHMRFAAPYVLYGALRAAAEDALGPHVAGYQGLLAAIRDDRFQLERAEATDVIQAPGLAQLIGGA